MKYSQNAHEDSEIVIGIIGPIGCNRNLVKSNIHALAKHYNYRVVDISISSQITEYLGKPPSSKDEYERVTGFMDAGNQIRKTTTDNAFLAKRAAARIRQEREKLTSKRIFYLIDSIKHPDEVDELKNIYGRGFYLFAIHSSEVSRDYYLETYCNIADAEQRKNLIERDRDDELGHGQNTSKAFHLADFFLTENGNNKKVCNSIQRFLKIIFGDPYQTPTFHEYAMFMAYSSSIRSSDMSRQVGAVIAKGTDVVSTGANECPKPGGGSYWPLFNSDENLIYDVAKGRDYMRGHDFNAKEKSDIISILKEGITDKQVLAALTKNIKKSGIEDITEFGRVVHAEMDAILGCARRGLSCDGAALFCTTFPCHNCAKHIISSGIKKVIYIEPYPKSKALEMHDDAISTSESDPDVNERVLFLPFVGVGPRQFVNFFSLSLSIGEKLKRKGPDGISKAQWDTSNAYPRVKMFETSYMKNEEEVAAETDAKMPHIKTSKSKKSK